MSYQSSSVITVSLNRIVSNILDYTCFYNVIFSIGDKQTELKNKKSVLKSDEILINQVLTLKVFNRLLKKHNKGIIKIVTVKGYGKIQEVGHVQFDPLDYKNYSKKKFSLQGNTDQNSWVEMKISISQKQKNSSPEKRPEPPKKLQKKISNVGVYDSEMLWNRQLSLSNPNVNDLSQSVQLKKVKKQKQKKFIPQISQIPQKRQQINEKSEPSEKPENDKPFKNGKNHESNRQIYFEQKKQPQKQKQSDRSQRLFSQHSKSNNSYYSNNSKLKMMIPDEMGLENIPKQLNESHEEFLPYELKNSSVFKETKKQTEEPTFELFPKGKSMKAKDYVRLKKVELDEEQKNHVSFSEDSIPKIIKIQSNQTSQKVSQNSLKQSPLQIVSQRQSNIKIAQKISQQQECRKPTQNTIGETNPLLFIPDIKKKTSLLYECIDIQQPSQNQYPDLTKSIENFTPVKQLEKPKPKGRLQRGKSAFDHCNEFQENIKKLQQIQQETNQVNCQFKDSKDKDKVQSNVKNCELTKTMQLMNKKLKNIREKEKLIENENSQNYYPSFSDSQNQIIIHETQSKHTPSQLGTSPPENLLLSNSNCSFGQKIKMLTKSVEKLVHENIHKIYDIKITPKSHKKQKKFNIWKQVQVVIAASQLTDRSVDAESFIDKQVHKRYKMICKGDDRSKISEDILTSNKDASFMNEGNRSYLRTYNQIEIDNDRIELESFKKNQFMKLFKMYDLTNKANLSRKRNQFLIKQNQELIKVKIGLDHRLDVSKRIIEEKQNIINTEFEKVKEQIEDLTKKIQEKKQQAITRQEKVVNLQNMSQKFLRQNNDYAKEIKQKTKLIHDLRYLLSYAEEKDKEEETHDDIIKRKPSTARSERLDKFGSSMKFSKIMNRTQQEIDTQDKNVQPSFFSAILKAGNAKIMPMKKNSLISYNSLESEVNEKKSAKPRFMKSKIYQKLDNSSHNLLDNSAYLNQQQRQKLKELGILL